MPIRLITFSALALLLACTQQTATQPTRSPSTAQASATGTASPEKAWSIAAAGDIACSAGQNAHPSATSCGQKKTSDLLVGSALDAVLTLGDNQYESGALRDYRAVFDSTWGRLKKILHPSPGNHDGSNGYFDYFGAAAGTRGEGWYSFDVGPWHVISLNSNCAAGGCAAGSRQERWLREDLAAHRAQCTLAYWHHPRFSSGLHGSDDRFTPFWRALYRAGADVVLSGHDHDYERFGPQDPDGVVDPARGIREFVVGTGGRNLYGVLYGRANSQYHSSRTFGVLFLSLRASGYSWRFVDVRGRAVDSGTGKCH